MYSIDPIDENAKKILDYMKLGMRLERCDAILGLGTLDKRVGERAAQLMLNDYADLLIFSGGYGKITKSRYDKTEAETFQEIATGLGVAPDKILLETKSTNIGENIRFTEQLLKNEAIKLRSLLVVTKPYMERRVYAAFKRQWPEPGLKLVVTSPTISYEEYCNQDISKELFLNIMVGDLQRIKLFSALGFQIEQAIPQDVWRAFESLVAQGYDKHLIE